MDESHQRPVGSKEWELGGAEGRTVEDFCSHETSHGRFCTVGGNVGAHGSIP